MIKKRKFQFFSWSEKMYISFMTLPLMKYTFSTSFDEINVIFIPKKWLSSIHNDRVFKNIAQSSLHSQQSHHCLHSQSMALNYTQKHQASKYLKIGTCPASQKLLEYMGFFFHFTRNTKIFTCPATWGTPKYELTSVHVIFEIWVISLLHVHH